MSGRVAFAGQMRGSCAIESLRECRSASETLQIGLPSQRIIFGKFVDSCEGTIQQVQFALESGVACFREDCNQTVDHGPEAPCHLEVFSAVKADFPAGELHEVIPVRCREDEPQPSFCIQQLIVV